MLSTIGTSTSSISSVDSKLKLKLCRAQNSTNEWHISQSTSSVELPVDINSCKSVSKCTTASIKKKSILNKARRRIRFIPTMVKIPPSTFDRLSNKRYDYDDTCQTNETNILNVEDSLINTSQVKQTILMEKTICKVPPYIPENLTTTESSSSIFEKSTSIQSPFDNIPLDLSLK